MITGRRSIFRGKDKSIGIEARGLTRHGYTKFKQARATLVRLARTHAPSLFSTRTEASDADVIEYLARGHDDTVAYLCELESSAKAA